MGYPFWDLDGRGFVLSPVDPWISHEVMYRAWPFSLPLVSLLVSSLRSLFISAAGVYILSSSILIPRGQVLPIIYQTLDLAFVEHLEP